jgi:hypothetical protein
MDSDSLEQLQTPQGRLALDEAMQLAPDEQTFLSCFNRLSRRHPAALARVALETALLRRRAAGKFSRAAEMFFCREALEQASGEPAARHRARRFEPFGLVADLCCGLGGDAVALAGRGAVLAVDLDPLRLRLCELNLDVHGLRPRARLVRGDALQVPLDEAEAVFIDPDRRVAGERQLSLAACRPALPEVLARLPAGLPVAAKLAPGVPWRELAALGGEAEFVSVAGELKECLLWLGGLRTTARRATVLPGGDTLAADAPAPPPGCAPVGRYLYDPDPAVIRAGLVTDLARRLGATQLDPSIAYLSADTRLDTPFARLHRVEADLPFHLGRLRDYLRQRGVGQVRAQRRGSAIDPLELVRKLRLRGSARRTLLLTRLEGRPWVVVADPDGCPEEEGGKGGAV